MVQIKAVYHNRMLIGSVPVTGDAKKDRDAAFQFLKDKGLYREVTTVQAMYRQAMSFAHTALMLHDRLRASGHAQWTSPFVVNQAFAMEMLLKTLAAAHGVQLKGHNLAKLLAKQPADALKAIDAAITKLSGADAPKPESGALCLGELPPPGASRTLLENTLRALAEAFVKWRYFYETGAASRVNIPSAMFAATVLEQACIDSGVKG